MADFTQQAALLNERIINNQATLLRHMEQLIQASSFKAKDRYATAAETFQLDIHADHIIKAAEDLLKLSRELKEAWVLNQAGGGADEKGLDEEIKENARVVGHALRKFCTDTEAYMGKEEGAEAKAGADKMDERSG